MRVQNVKRAEQNQMAARKKDMHGVDSDKHFAFHRTLTQLTEEQYRERIEQLRAGIDKQAELLSDRMDIKELEKYRKLVREFLDEIVSNGYTFSRESAYASRGKHRFVATVKVINEKLDEIGQEFLREQADKIEILGKIDDIRGLLLDLMM